MRAGACLFAATGSDVQPLDCEETDLAVSSNNTVLGKYRILREIARSNDIVYEAIDAKMNRRVAVKELQLPVHLAGAQKRERVERFYREAKAAGTLTHPNIVTIHEVGQENDRHFLVMEYLDGQSLRDILQIQGALPLKETVEISLQMCDALSYAHAHGIVHRDVKPDNIHILPGGIIKLTDFGIARITAEPSITSHGQVFGTPSYMSPEQVASSGVDHRTDLFSMAITLYEMTTGRKPFTGDSVITITYNIMNSQPPMPVGVPAALQDILQKGLAKDPNLRYQSAAAMAADLRATKFALDSPQNAKSAGRVKMGDVSAGVSDAGTLDTGRVSPIIAPFPGIGGQQPPPYPMAMDPSGAPPQSGTAYGTQAGSTAAPGYYPSAYDGPIVGGLAPDDYGPRASRPRGRRSNPQEMVGLIFAVIGLIAVISAIVYGINQAFSAVQANNKRSEAVRYANQAQQALRAGNYEAAANSYQAAREAAPANTQEAQTAAQGFSSVETARAMRAAKNGDSVKAQASFQQAIEADAHNAAAYDNWANNQFAQNDMNGAMGNWQKAIDADASSPAAADARNRLTRLYMQRGDEASGKGDFADARTSWQQVIAVNPGSPEAAQAQSKITSTPFPGVGAGN